MTIANEIIYVDWRSSCDNSFYIADLMSFSIVEQLFLPSLINAIFITSSDWYILIHNEH